MSPAGKRARGTTCRHCRLTFIGPAAIHAWSAHTWVHYIRPQP